MCMSKEVKMNISCLKQAVEEGENKNLILDYFTGETDTTYKMTQTHCRSLKVYIPFKCWILLYSYMPKI